MNMLTKPTRQEFVAELRDRLTAEFRGTVTEDIPDAIFNMVVEAFTALQHRPLSPGEHEREVSMMVRDMKEEERIAKHQRNVDKQISDLQHEVWELRALLNEV